MLFDYFIVPDVTGISQIDAEAAIIDAALVVGNISGLVSHTIPEGHVISQTPTGGQTVLWGSPVNLIVSLGNFPDPPGMVWVDINDPGVPGHEGFNGQMSKYETTNAQYCGFLNAALASGDIYVDSNIVYGSNGSNSGADFVDIAYLETFEAGGYSQITYSGGTFSVRCRDGYSMANHPVVFVSWPGATAFCNYYGYRLPTEWEWQAVADYDGSYTYGCGTSINSSKANYSWSSGDFCNPLNLSDYPYTSPVDYYFAYGYGINDMTGNVMEWTSSCYYAGCDPSYRVLRGGSWNGTAFACSVSRQHSTEPHNSGYEKGFRACR